MTSLRLRHLAVVAAVCICALQCVLAQPPVTTVTIQQFAAPDCAGTPDATNTYPAGACTTSSTAYFPSMDGGYVFQYSYDDPSCPNLKTPNSIVQLQTACINQETGTSSNILIANEEFTPSPPLVFPPPAYGRIIETFNHAGKPTCNTSLASPIKIPSVFPIGECLGGEQIYCDSTSNVIADFYFNDTGCHTVSDAVFNSIAGCQNGITTVCPFNSTIPKLPTNFNVALVEYQNSTKCDTTTTTTTYAYGQGQCAFDRTPQGNNLYVIYQCDPTGTSLTRTQYSDSRCQTVAGTATYPVGSCLTTGVYSTEFSCDFTPPTLETEFHKPTHHTRHHRPAITLPAVRSSHRQHHKKAKKTKKSMFV